MVDQSVYCHSKGFFFHFFILNDIDNIIAEENVHIVRVDNVFSYIYMQKCDKMMKHYYSIVQNYWVVK